jgi:hypothetical protein
MSESLKQLVSKSSHQNHAASSKSMATNPEKNVDLCFVIDATGSMGPYIDQVKNKVSNIITEVQKNYPGFEFRIAVVGYRDFDQGDKSFEVKPFCRDPKEIENFLRELVPRGGDDGPEDVNGAIQKVCGLEWKSFTRVIIHFADAPCHGRDFSNLPDKYPNPNSDAKWEELM